MVSVAGRKPHTLSQRKTLGATEEPAMNSTNIRKSLRFETAWVTLTGGKSSNTACQYCSSVNGTKPIKDRSTYWAICFVCVTEGFCWERPVISETDIELPPALVSLINPANVMEDGRGGGGGGAGMDTTATLVKWSKDSRLEDLAFAAGADVLVLSKLSWLLDLVFTGALPLVLLTSSIDLLAADDLAVGPLALLGSCFFVLCMQKTLPYYISSL